MGYINLDRYTEEMLIRLVETSKYDAVAEACLAELDKRRGVQKTLLETYRDNPFTQPIGNREMTYPCDGRVPQQTTQGTAMHNRVINARDQLTQNDRSASRDQKDAELLANDLYASIVSRGNGMISMTDLNIRMVLPDHVIKAITDNVVFVKVGTEEGKEGILTPVEAQLNVTFFTG